MFEEETGGRRAHKGEEYTTNKAEALVKYRARAGADKHGEVEAAIARARAREVRKGAGVVAQGVQRGEELRRRYVRETLEAGGAQGGVRREVTEKVRRRGERRGSGDLGAGIRRHRPHKSADGAACWEAGGVTRPTASPGV